MIVLSTTLSWDTQNHYQNKIMAFFAIAAAVVGGAVSIHGQRQAAKAAEQSAEWNADQQRKQAAYEETVAQKNMRRERENNKRELARRRATCSQRWTHGDWSGVRRAYRSL